MPFGSTKGESMIDGFPLNMVTATETGAKQYAQALVTALALAAGADRLYW